MTVSVAATPVRNILSGTTSHTTGAISSVANHETLGYFWMDRTGGGVVTGVTDDSTIAYTLRSTITVGTADTKFYTREDVAADASLAIVGTTSGSVNSQVLGVRLASSAGGVSYPIYHAAATPNRGEPIDGTNDTVHTSNAVTVSVGTALVISAMSCGNAQTTLPTARLYQDGVDVAEATVAPAAGAGVRVFFVYANVTQPGAYHFVVTLAGTSQSTMLPLAFTDDVTDPAPTIVDVDEDDAVTQEQQGIEADCTNVDTATFLVRQGGMYEYSLNIDSQDGDTVVFDMPDLESGGASPHPGAVTFVVKNADDQEGTRSGTVADETGTISVAVSNPGSTGVIVLTPPAESGDYVRWRVTGGSFDETNFTLNPDMTFQLDAGLAAEIVAETAVLELQAWDYNDGTWGQWADIGAQAAAGGSSTGNKFPVNPMMGRMLTRG